MHIYLLFLIFSQSINPASVSKHARHIKVANKNEKNAGVFVHNLIGSTCADIQTEQDLQNVTKCLLYSKLFYCDTK